MAVTSSIANLFSFFAPSPSTPAPKSPPSHLSFSSSASSSPSGTAGDRWAPLISSDEFHQPSSYSEAMYVVCPSLAYANTLFFQSAYNVQLIVEDNEPEEKLIGRFRREVMQAGVIQECKRRRFFENKQDEKKRKSREAARKNRRRQPQSRFGPPEREESSNNNRGNEDEDNWDLPQGDLPY